VIVKCYINYPILSLDIVIVNGYINNMNILLYTGIALMLFGFLLFIVREMRLAQIDRELFRQKQLEESWKKNNE
jgi:hypothetical protein